MKDGAKNTISQKLIKIDRALLRISNLAIHLQSADERVAFKVNKEDHMSPILALEVKKALEGTTAPESVVVGGDNDDKDEPEKEKDEDKKDGWKEHQEPVLIQLLAEELGVATEDIVDFELNLFDIQKASLAGAYWEFIHSARLDNLASCFLAIQALVDHVQDGNLENDEDISLVACFDHEEVGSSSA